MLTQPSTQRDFCCARQLFPHEAEWMSGQRTDDGFEGGILAEVTDEYALIFGGEVAVWLEGKILHRQVYRRIIAQQLQIFGNSACKHMRLQHFIETFARKHLLRFRQL